MNAQLVVFVISLFYAHAQFPFARNCNNKQFECDNGECMPKESWCQRHYYNYENCRDMSNVNHCSQNRDSCFANQVYCVNDERCIPLKWYCDGSRDCPDGSDETDCINGFRVEGIVKARASAKQWIIQQRKSNWGWKQDSARPIIALRLSNLDEFESDSTTRELMFKQLQIQLSKFLLRDDNVTSPVYKLAHFTHALIASCQDPRHVLGKNLIKTLQELSKHSTHLNPFVTLVLCNSNSTLSSSNVVELIEITLKPSTTEIIDLQAYALLALNCLHKRNSSFLETVYRTFLRSHNQYAEYENVTSKDNLLKNLQKKDGGFGNIYTTALVMQALTSAGNYDTRIWDPIKAYKYILQQQKSDGSFGNMMNTYLITPLLQGNTLLDLNRISCSLEQENIPNITVKEEFESKGIQKQRVQYSIWLNENKGVTFVMSVVVPVNISFYDLMHLAAELDTKYSFKYTSYQEGKYVYSIFGTSNDPEARTYWKLYRMEEDDLVFAGQYPDKIFPKDGDVFVYWYKQ